MLSTKLKHIISNIGKLDIDVFKEINIPDDSKLSLNCNGVLNDSIKINCPYGGISFKSKDIFFNNKNLLIQASNIKIKSLDKVIIDSINYIEFGSENSNICIDLENKNLRFDFTEYEKSFISFKTNKLSISTSDNSISLLDNIIIKSNNNIILGSLYNNIIKVDCKYNKVNINGDILINGKLFIKDNLIKCKSIEHIITTNVIKFDTKNSIYKDWSIIENSDSSNGIYFNDKNNIIEFKNNNNKIPILSKSIYLGDHFSDIDDGHVINANNKFILDSNYNLSLNGNLKLYGNIDINDNIVLDHKGSIIVNNDIILSNFSLSNLFKYTVGKLYKFENIQDCVNYIETNELYKDQSINIEIFPNKIYYENIIISKPNINLLGMNNGITLIGSVTINIISDNKILGKSDISIRNINVISNHGKSNIFKCIKNIHNNILNLKIQNSSFNLKNNSKLNISNFKKIFLEETEIISDNESELNIIDVNCMTILRSKININSKYSCNKLLIFDSDIDFSKIWVINSKIIKFIRCDFLIKNINLLNKVLITNVKCFLFNIIATNNSENKYYDKLIIKFNFIK